MPRLDAPRPPLYLARNRALRGGVVTTKKAKLVLEDGRVFDGERFGADVEAIGEVVFNTAMSGYQEILTDPSYRGQMICMTYPLIGNTGINPEDVESRDLFAAGFIIRNLSVVPSSWRSRLTLDEYLKQHNVPGITEIDTRALTRHLRDHGSKMGVIADADQDTQELIAKVRTYPAMLGKDLVKDISVDKDYVWSEGSWTLDHGYPKYTGKNSPRRGGKTYKVVALDFGIKWNILRLLADSGCQVTVVPADTSAEQVLALEPDGVFLSNGPGDPEPVVYGVDTVKHLLGKKPMFGICLGHQILGLALGGKTYKLKFGHHGANQPVKDALTGRVEITSQNHNFAVDIASLGGDIYPTHTNLNDETNEGFAHKKLPVFSVQYHPEASPGPHDSSYLFDRFVRMMAANEPVVDADGHPTQSEERDSA
ncbi:MAG: glutamine-hydrolyzing carbamoyl-phosphate synthase small subunit [Deltaproteobacteria bacterium]|nr:glutamine-hydrolyzing carbamoyl-phosphate synthase small subunit [Deltaproteobacteria bacterium]